MATFSEDERQLCLRYVYNTWITLPKYNTKLGPTIQTCLVCIGRLSVGAVGAAAPTLFYMPGVAKGMSRRDFYLRVSWSF